MGKVDKVVSLLPSSLNFRAQGLCTSVQIGRVCHFFSDSAQERHCEPLDNHCDTTAYMICFSVWAK